MPGYILHQGADVKCMHLGPAQPMMTYPRVTVGGNPIVVRSDTYSVTACQFPAWTLGGSPPCSTAAWTMAATRLFAGGDNVLLFDSQSQCTPNGTPLQIFRTQVRATGT
ncbi:MAG: hypothetical protein J0H42_29705 [Rhizobiales bacterium]|nr:hypothetical protein [Hyphomicrobiales bacterium]